MPDVQAKTSVQGAERTRTAVLAQRANPSERVQGYATRLDNAQARVAEVASDYCWDPTPEGMTALRHAVAEWRSAVGLWRLAVRQEKS
jgi:hypothetical protein